MEKDFCGTVKNVGGFSKKEKPLDYYFWVVDKVKISQSLYSDQKIISLGSIG